MNLLPHKEQKNILADYRMRIAVVGLFSATVLVTVALTLLIPGFIMANGKESLAESQLAQATANGGSGVGAEDPKDVVRGIDAKVLLLAPADGGDHPATEIIEALLAHQTQGIAITALFFDVAADGGRMTITGNATLRKDLAEFEKALKSDVLFSSVDLPRSNYLKPGDIDFSIMIVLAGEKKDASKEPPKDPVSN